MPGRLVFRQASRAWYAGTDHPMWTAMQREGLTEEIMVGSEGEGGGCRWEFRINWKNLTGGRPDSMRVLIYWDAFAAFEEAADFFSRLAVLEKWKDYPQPQQILNVLVACGFEDATQTTAPPLTGVG